MGIFAEQDLLSKEEWDNALLNLGSIEEPEACHLCAGTGKDTHAGWMIGSCPRCNGTGNELESDDEGV